MPPPPRAQRNKVPPPLDRFVYTTVRLMAKLLCLLFLGTACAVAQTVEGTVLDAATGSGVAGVKVELVQEGSVLYDTITDPAGRFHFDKVKEGDYGDRYQSTDHWLTAG